MNSLLSVARYEFRMAASRRAMWFITALLIVFLVLATQPVDTSGDASQWLPTSAGFFAFSMNIFIPVIAGVMSADRAIRDTSLHTRELLRSTSLPNATYVAGKYLGVVASLLLMQTIIVIIVSVAYILRFGIPVELLFKSLSAAVLINYPAILFVTAFSLLCPLIMPVRVYQILFTGYWYWGNFVSPDFFPSISDTLLNAAGRFALYAFFASEAMPGTEPGFALLNIAVVLGCALLALLAMWQLLELRSRKEVGL